jgi:peptide/nickel transport system permease protein
VTRASLHIGGRFLQAVFVVWGVTLVTFFVSRVLPGNPAYLLAGQNADAETIKAMTEHLGLNHSIPDQYGIYMSNLVRGDLGTAFTTSAPVTTDLGQRIPATAELALVALLLAVLISLSLGIAAALRPRGLVSRLADALSAAGVAMPQFWLGLLLLYFFTYKLGWTPPPLGRLPDGPEPHKVTGFLLIDTLLAGDFGAWRHALGALVLPAVTLALTVQPPLLRLVQAVMARTLESDAIRTARALGLSFRQVVYHDALRLALLPILNMIGLVFGILISSSVFVEYVFSWPGIGQYAVQAINASDYPAIQGVVLVGAVAFVGVYFLIDVVETFIDPRVRA